MRLMVLALACSAICSAPASAALTKLDLAGTVFEAESPGGQSIDGQRFDLSFLYDVDASADYIFASGPTTTTADFGVLNGGSGMAPGTLSVAGHSYTLDLYDTIEFTDASNGSSLEVFASNLNSYFNILFVSRTSFLYGTNLTQSISYAASLADITSGDFLVDQPDGDARGEFIVDRISSGPLSAVPEPSSWVMMIGGFGLIGFDMRRWHKRSEDYIEAEPKDMRALA